MTTHRIYSSFWTLAVCFASAVRFTGRSGLHQCVVSASSFLTTTTRTTGSTTKAPLLPTPPSSSSSSVVVARQMSSSSSSSSSTRPKLKPGDALFGKFIIPADSIFYRSPTAHSLAFVNLRPIVPGHVLVIPAHNICESMSDLSVDEYTDLWQTVRVVQDILRQHYTTAATAFNVAVQDGKAAGQSVPHVHVHILPRCSSAAGDYFSERNDDVYDELQEWAPCPPDRQSSSTVANNKLNVPNDSERRDRTVQEMADEAAIYRAIVEKRK